MSLNSNYDEDSTLDSNYDEEDTDEYDESGYDSTLDENDFDTLADVLDDADFEENDFLKLWKKRKNKKQKRKGKPCRPNRARASIARLREARPASNMPLERRGELILRALFRNGSVVGTTDRATSRVYPSGATTLVYLNKFRDYKSLRAVVVANTLGASVKTYADGLKVAAVALSVVNSQSAWGYVIKISTPFQTARNQGITLTVTLGGVGTVMTLRADPVVRPGLIASMMEFVVISAASNAGIGQPANATSCTVLIADGQAGVVDAATSVQIESLNARDLGVTDAVSCK